MARISLPFLNKTGYSMYWDSVWDDRENFNNFLIKNLFVTSVMPYFYKDNPTFRFSSEFFQKNNVNKISLERNFDYTNYTIFVTDEYNNEISTTNVDWPKVHIYSSKIWFLKYQNWIITYVFVYISNFNKTTYIPEDRLFGDELNLTEKDIGFGSFTILNNFFFYANKLNYNYSFVKKQLSNLNEF